MRELLLSLFCLSEFFILTSTAPADWSEVILVKEGTDVALPCTDEAPVDVVKVTWMMTSSTEKAWMSVLSANIEGEMENREWWELRDMGDRSLEFSEDLSLRFIATKEAGGRYSCEMQQEGGRLRKRIVVLALVKLTVVPALSVPRETTVRLKAEVSPSYVVAGGEWLSPTGARLLTDVTSVGILLTKLPRATLSDSGVYTCSIKVDGKSSKPVFSFGLTVTVNDKVAPFPNITYDPTLRQVALTHSAVLLRCPSINGDYIRLFWWRPDEQREEPELIFQFDLWRNSKKQDKPQLQLLNTSSSAHSRNFSFLLTPELMDAGNYQCEVFLDDKVFGQSTTLTVLHGYVTPTHTSIDLNCAYAERSQVSSLKFSHLQRPELLLQGSGVPGNLHISVDLPVSPETAGQYACTVQLQNQQTARYVHTIMMGSTERPCCLSETWTTGSLLPATVLLPGGSTASEASVLLSSLSLLLFLVPLSAVAVGVLLWRRGPCTSPRNVELTMSHCSGELENVYENPEDLRQTTSSSAVYMDLKPTGETDVYRELDRYDPCCG